MDGSYEALIGDMTPLIMEELNVKNVKFAKELDTYMNFSLKPNFKVAGPVLGKNIKAFGGALAKEDAKEFIGRLESEEGAVLELNGEDVKITPDMVDVRIDAKEGFAVAMENNVFAILDTTLNEDLVDEGLAREIISKIQQMRKQMQLEMMDNITISLGADEDVQKAVEKHADYIKSETLALSIEKAEDLKTVNINGHKTGLGIKKMC